MRLIGRYELRERIGEGAMAEVWRAYDPSIDRVLAIKILKQELRENAEYSARFLREAKAAGALAHPAIVTIYDVGEADGYPYIAMELLEGEPMDAVLERDRKLPCDRVLSIAAQLASALSYSHLSGVVHRDIKPSNIMLGPDGRSVKILDFGIARLAEADAERTELEHLKTQIGQVLGTPRYMSPEQALGHEVDGRSDLFSVGVVLYELVTGEKAFSGGSVATLALQITQQSPPPIASLEPTCPGGLRFIIEKLLAKRPEKRFADGAEFSRALERERKAYDAVQADAAARGHYLSLQLRLTLAMVAVTALVLLASIGAVLKLQYQAMERMTLSSGASIASFVASNAALPSVENASAPPEERDWMPIQAFIAAAAKDQSVRWMTMVDADGVIRGSSDAKLLGTPYHAPSGQSIVRKEGDVSISDVKLPDGQAGFLFVHPILYAGRNFGLIEVSLTKAGLMAAAATSRDLMVGLSLIVLLVVGALSFVINRSLARPVRRLKTALQDAAMGDLDFRISHSRKDEFGELFDGFNLLITSLQERLTSMERPTGRTVLVDATQIGQPTTALRAVVSDTPKGTPFDANQRQRQA